MSRDTLTALEKRVMDMVRVLYMNLSKCFSRKNNKNYTKAEATKMLDNTLEELGVNYQRQYDLIKGVLASDKKKFDKIKKEDISDREVLEILVSKGIQTMFCITFEIRKIDVKLPWGFRLHSVSGFALPIPIILTMCFIGQV